MPDEMPAVPAVPSLPPFGRSLKILYAEDMLELQAFVSLVLTRAGHEVQSAGDGEVALNILKNSVAPFDLLLTDHQMPKLNGLELVRQARQMNFTGKIAVFAAELNPEIHQQYRLLGADPILAKPISPSILRARLEQIFAADGQ